MSHRVWLEKAREKDMKIRVPARDPRPFLWETGSLIDGTLLSPQTPHTDNLKSDSEMEEQNPALGERETTTGGGKNKAARRLLATQQKD